MLKYRLIQDNRKNAATKGFWYARAVVENTMTLEELARHMADHNTPFSEGVIKGILTDMVNCIRELVLEGKAVKIPNLAIFSIGVQSKGSETVKDFNATKNITGFRLRSRATGVFTRQQLKQAAHVREQAFYDVKPEEDGTEPGTDGDNDPQEP